jgi:hypothetical protein
MFHVGGLLLRGSGLRPRSAIAMTAIALATHSNSNRSGTGSAFAASAGIFSFAIAFPWAEAALVPARAARGGARGMTDVSDPYCRTRRGPGRNCFVAGPKSGGPVVVVRESQRKTRRPP